MRSREPPKVCLATATTERFMPGTLVLIGSFLRRHPGFAGDVVVVHDDGLPETLREVLAATFDGCRSETEHSKCTRLCVCRSAACRVATRQAIR